MNATQNATSQVTGTALELGLFGVILGGMLGAGCFVPIAIALDLLLTPPLNGPANYGQIGFLAIVLGCLLGAIGSSICIKPLIGRCCVFILQVLVTALAVTVLDTLIGKTLWTSTLFVAAGMLTLLLISALLILGDRVDRFVCSLRQTPTQTQVRDKGTIG